MRKSKVENKYNLTFADIMKLSIVDRSQLKEPLFWRNDVVGAWCISGTTIKNEKDSRYGTYNEFWIGIYDEDKPLKNKLKVNCSSHGGMCGYTFKEFYNAKEIENEMDLEIQEKLLETVNNLIDKGILSLKEIH